MEYRADYTAHYEGAQHRDYACAIRQPHIREVDVTYGEFLAVFLGVPITVLVVVLRVRLHLSNLVLLAALAVVALVYTAPWDNLLVASGVWTYRLDRVSGALAGRVPVEEYVFYVLQVLATGLWMYWLAQRVQR
jgi:lycopene cyclase domain-containing protein